MALSRSSIGPASDSMAVLINACCAISSANPLVTAASMNASFVSRLAVWLLIAVSMAANCSDVVPESDSSAFRIISCRALLSAKPSETADSISVSFCDNVVLTSLMASTILL